MSGPDLDWLQTGRGLRPRLRWSLTVDAPLVGMELARETGELLAADASGGLYLLDRAGKLSSLSRGFHHLGALAWSDAGCGGAAVFGESTLCLFDRQLKIEWSTELPDAILAIATDPRRQYVVASLANATSVVYDCERRKIGRFETYRPLSFVRCLVAEPRIIAAADYGLLCCHALDGKELWSKKLYSNAGDMTVTGDGRTIFLAGFTQGVQRYDAAGENCGSYVVGGTPDHVSTAFEPNRLAVSTVERHLYWLDEQGEMVWAGVPPDDVCRLQCEPLGTGLICGFRSGRLARLAWPM